MNLAILDGICIYPTETGQRAFCPECGGAVISKVGAIKEPHWAHLAETNCEGYYKPMSEWHRSWQEKFPKEWREIFTKKDGEVCIADVKTPRRTTIEFQHSPISKENIAKRKRVHGDVFWVLDGSTYDYFTKLVASDIYPSVILTLIVYENTGFEDMETFIRNHDWAKNITYTKSEINRQHIDGFYSYKYLFKIEVIIGRKNENLKYCYKIAHSFISDILEAKNDNGFMNGTEFEIKNGSINATIQPIKKVKHCIYYGNSITKFHNSSGVFIDKAKGVPEDSLLQVFEYGTFKIFKKEGFIEKLLSHAQTKTNQ